MIYDVILYAPSLVWYIAWYILWYIYRYISTPNMIRYVWYALLSTSAWYTYHNYSSKLVYRSVLMHNWVSFWQLYVLAKLQMWITRTERNVLVAKCRGTYVMESGPRNVTRKAVKVSDLPKAWTKTWPAVSPEVEMRTRDHPMTWMSGKTVSSLSLIWTLFINAWSR